MNFMSEGFLRHELLTRLLKHITGHREQPNVQQQQMHPQKSHFMLPERMLCNRLAFQRTQMQLTSVRGIS